MVEIIRGSTEVLTIEVEDDTFVLPTTDRIIVTISSGSYTLDKTGADLAIVDGNIEVTLTQAESLRLREGVEAELQVNFLIPSAGGADVRIPTETVSFLVGKQLHPKVMTHD